MPARSASRPATPRSCAAAPRASTRRARSSPASRTGCTRPGCPRPRSRARRPPIGPRSAIMLTMSDQIDVIVPRGGPSLIERVQRESRIPVLAHRDGICHVYLHAAADPAMAREITLNAKMRRTSVCGAAETLLVDREGGDAAAAGRARGAARGRLRSARRARGPGLGPADRRRDRGRLVDRVSGRDPLDQAGRRPGCRDRARQPLRLAPHRHAS